MEAMRILREKRISGAKDQHCEGIFHQDQCDIVDPEKVKVIIDFDNVSGNIDME
jgi:hypothetical protein